MLATALALACCGSARTVSSVQSRPSPTARVAGDQPHPCFTGASSGGYAKKHNPFAYYTADRAACAHVVPLTHLKADERNHALPRFIWITPNLCHDMHDCDSATGDRFLSRLLPPL